MNREQFIRSQGATCRNWRWSWSFINKRKKIVIFGAWDTDTKGDRSLILSEDWEIGPKCTRQPGYAQAREHLRLIEDEGYQLMTFPIIYSDARLDEKGIGPSTIADFDLTVTAKTLKRVGKNWYATEEAVGNFLPEEIVNPEMFSEGASKIVSVNRYERISGARARCIEHHGYKCMACSFDFEQFYGSLGKDYIHVHHRVPLSEIKKEYKLDPIKDLVSICPNCHAILHRRIPALTVDQLREHLKKSEKR